MVTPRGTQPELVLHSGTDINEELRIPSGVFTVVKISENYVKVNGIRLYYEELGAGYSLVLLHGGIRVSLN